MADSSSTVVLNIGSQRIGMAVLEAAKNGKIILKAYDSELISADPAMEAARSSQTNAAIATLAKRLKIGKAKVRYTISGQSTFTRFAKLPPINSDNMDQLVTFEAKQQIPFPLEEVVWDYEMIEGSAEKEAAIVAIKIDALDEINNGVLAAGLTTTEVDVAPMALYNTFRNTYGYPEGETILLVDIGAKSTNLLYIEGRRFFTRSVPVGGSAVTTGIAKDYSISFAEAETQKIANGLVSMGGSHTSQLSEQQAGLATSIRNSLTRLIAEITRTTSYYRSTHAGSAPTRIMLAGGGASLPYSAEFFQEKLGIPVQYFSALEKVTLGKGLEQANLPAQSHLLGELIGLGLRSVGKSTINLDLVPSSLEANRISNKRKPFLVAASAICLLGVGSWAGFNALAASKATEITKNMQSTSETLQPIGEKIDQLLKIEGSIAKVADAYVRSENGRATSTALITELRDAFSSEFIWLTDLEPVAGYAPFDNDPKARLGRSVIKPEFTSLAYGSSALNDLTPDNVAKGKKAEPLTVNAVRVRGYWRDNDQKSSVVNNAVSKLKEKSKHFVFSLPDSKGKVQELKDDQIILNLVANKTVKGIDPAQVAYPFEIILPLVPNANPSK